MRVVEILTQRAATFFASLVLLAVFLGLLFVQAQARQVVEAFRAEVEGVKSEYLIAFQRGKDSAGALDKASAGLSRLWTGTSFRVLASAYAKSLGPGLPTAPSADLGFLEKIQVLEHLVMLMTGEQKASSDVLVSLLIVLILTVAGLVFWSETQGQKKLLAARYERDLGEQLLESLENERSLLAFDLHDSVTQKLGFLKQQIEDHHGNCPRNLVIRQLVTESVGEIRSLHQGLTQGDSPDIGLTARLADLFSQFALVSEIRLETTVFGLEELNLDRTTANHLFRIVQELLSNGHKHSRARTIILNVFSLPPCIRILYSDDGNGLSRTASEVPKTMRSLEFRTRLLKATLKVGRLSETGGVTLQIEVPHENSPVG